MRTAELGPAAAPTPDPEAKPRFQDDDIDFILAEEDKKAEMKKAENEAEEQRSAQQAQEQAEAKANEPPAVQYGRETLSTSHGMRQLIREQTFNRISGADMVKAELENGVAHIKRPLLERKRNAEQRKIKRYEHKAKTSMFAFRRESYAQKARWAKRRHENVNIKLSKHNAKYGNGKQKDPETGKVTVDRGKAYEASKRRYIERMRMLELQRSKLLEEQLVAKERKRRREMKNGTWKKDLTEEQRLRMTHALEQLPAMGKYREEIQQQLKKELGARMEKAAEKIKSSDRRWRWDLDNAEQAENPMDGDKTSGNVAEDISSQANESEPFAPERNESSEAVDAYEPTSSYISERGLESFAGGEVSASRLFGAESAGDDVAEREALIEESPSAQKYGDSLKELIAENGAEETAGKAKRMNKQARQVLEGLDVPVSAYTTDGSWALWDMGQQKYIQDHPEEQDQYVHDDLDRRFYVDEAGKMAPMVARQVARDFLTDAREKGEFDKKKYLFPKEVLEIVEKAVGDTDGSIQIKPSEYAVVGLRLMQVYAEAQNRQSSDKNNANLDQQKAVE